MKLYNYIDKSLLHEMIASGFIKVRANEDNTLFIYNYTSKTQYDNVWNEATLKCRGLIVNLKDEIIARPFGKIFNYAGSDIEFDLSERIEVTTKLDGSLGILYQEKNEYKIATRGSFNSDQAIKATSIFNSKYRDRFQPKENYTYLFEILYPENRIVVDYNLLEDIILITAIENGTGQELNRNDLINSWPGRIVDIEEYNKDEDIFTLKHKDNCEGIVIRFMESNTRVKIKQDEYLRIHYMLSTLTKKRIWSILKEGKMPEEEVRGVPDEFYGVVKKTISELHSKYKLIEEEAKLTYLNIISKLPLNYSRKDFALAVEANDNRKLLFMIHDKLNYDFYIWNMIEPDDEYLKL